VRERLLLPADELHTNNRLSYQQLALVEILGIGCHAVNRAQVTATDTVLIIGAGPIGLTVLEFARLAGAQVPILELNATRRAFVQRTWPDVHVLSAPPEEASAQIVFDATGHAGSMGSAFRYGPVHRQGRLCRHRRGTGCCSMILSSHRRELTLLASRNAVAADFTRILSLIEEGKINTNAWIV